MVFTSRLAMGSMQPGDFAIWRSRNSLARMAQCLVCLVGFIARSTCRGYAALCRDWARSAPAAAVVATKPSIAVLSLRNLSGDPANDYFSDGMTEEINTKLSRIQGLKVASYSSTLRFKSAQKSPEEIGRELQVRYLLAGSVRKAANQVRVAVQLIDASTGVTANE